MFTFGSRGQAGEAAKMPDSGNFCRAIYAPLTIGE
jgi:hypothetical protein